MTYLEDYLIHNKLTAVVVSHDGSFLDAVCTDMIKMEDKRLNYHVGNVSLGGSVRDFKLVYTLPPCNV